MPQEGGGNPSWLQKIVGFADTDLGLGLIVEAIFAKDDSYAPTLQTMVESGPLKPKEQAALDHFLEALVQSPISISDLNLGNIVYGISEGESERFVLIDGVGYKEFIPIAHMSRGTIRWNNRRKVRRLLAELATETGNAKNDCAPT